MKRGLLLLLGLFTACGGVPRPVDRGPAPELVGVWYTVQAGDTLDGLAQRYRVPQEDLLELNGIVDPKQLAVGQPIFLYGVKRLLEEKAREPKKKVAPKAKKTGTGKKTVRYTWPLKKGVLTSGFGKRGRRMHKGIDIAASRGTKIFATAAGKVIYSDNKQRGYGNLVILEHANGVVSVYAHNRRNLVDVGEIVRQGAPIAEVGNTGRSTGPHLHFELRIRGKARDPLRYLPAR